MTDNSASELARLESDREQARAALEAADAKVAKFREANREPKLAELKKAIADYGFTQAEVFGVPASTAAKPKAKASGARRGAAVVKYKDDNGNTWGGGKGPVPKWITEIRAANGDIEKYRVKGT